MRYVYSFGDDEFEFEPEYKDVKEALIEAIIEESGETSEGAKKMAEYVVENLDIVDVLEEEFEDYLHDYFEDEAREEYRDEIAYEKDEADWFGTKSNILGGGSW